MGLCEKTHRIILNKERTIPLENERKMAIFLISVRLQPHHLTITKHHKAFGIFWQCVYFFFHNINDKYCGNLREWSHSASLINLVLLLLLTLMAEAWSSFQGNEVWHKGRHSSSLVGLKYSWSFRQSQLHRDWEMKWTVKPTWLTGHKMNHITEDPPRSPWSKLIPLMQTHNSQPRIPLWLWHDNGMQRITVAEATFFTTLFLTVSSSPMRQTWSHEDFPGTFWLSVCFRRRIEALVHLLLFWAEQGDASTGPGQNIGSNNRLVLLFMCNSALHPGREWSFDSESTLQISSTGCVELKFSSRIFHWCFFSWGLCNTHNVLRGDLAWAVALSDFTKCHTSYLAARFRSRYSCWLLVNYLW